ncbi:DNA mismatch repair protein MutS [Methanocalculus chunghsingensis]|uniref:DNA mismatch repair protein MutS n=1 Tax=Methanocalculus chunghsingensis TaxID=156457 RepID=A0A8J7W5Z8_9EURY|nr:DNA mismatch repair protein MutS [Methanocalculus chunghsingensis]MBR1368183.1 DNA mismatch repair protein MutS [Methanocalculus chunghsingensis]
MASHTQLTPAMKQFWDMKNQYPDCILLVRMGDFYETFYEDAVTCARELDIVLTTRSKDPEGNPIALAGVPYHAAETYIPRLVRKGYRVAICEQVEDPKKAKGVVKRDVVRVVTPGCAIDPMIIDAPESRYLMAILPDRKNESFGIACLELSTGEFFVRMIQKGEGRMGIASLIEASRPAECLIPERTDPAVTSLIASLGVVITERSPAEFDPADSDTILCRQFGVASLEGFGLREMPLAVGAAGAAFSYATRTQKTALPHLSEIRVMQPSEGMILDAVTQRNLEITRTERGEKSRSTLLGTLDLTKSPMGRRRLSMEITAPLTSISAINERLDLVEWFIHHPLIRSDIEDLLSECSDIERIAGRIAYGNASPRDLLSLAGSLSSLVRIRTCLSGEVPPLMDKLSRDIGQFGDIIALIESAIADDPPLLIRNGGVIREGYDPTLDELRKTAGSGREWILTLQQSERERTGIKSLKIAYNQVFGYYIEVTKPNLTKVPPEYERKQTTATGERFTLPELREYERTIATADERALLREAELYIHLIEELRPMVPAFQKAARATGMIDLLLSFALVAERQGYTRPGLTGGGSIRIRGGRHPVVESTVTGGYVPNDTDLDTVGDQILILTGANMAGKSTYMRSVALICIMAQTGSFVPADAAEIGVIDRIFTRVGASDDLAGGQSTFMVEMVELASILRNATERSLILLDEIGRGTSTVDGYSIARSVLEYLHGKRPSGPKTLFATHFHRLVEVEGELSRVRNYHFAVRETEKEITFLRKLIPGATDRSYGIHVARIAGVPEKVLIRADSILKEVLEEEERGGTEGRRRPRYTQLLISDLSQEKPPESPVLAELRQIDIDRLSPIEALNILSDLKKRAGD